LADRRKRRTVATSQENHFELCRPKVSASVGGGQSRLANGIYRVEREWRQQSNRPPMWAARALNGFEAND
jgi:hypothetical protein